MSHVLDETLRAALVQAAVQADETARLAQGLRARKPPVLPSIPLQARGGPPRRPPNHLRPRGVQLRLF